jgi:hypothetical protein
VRAYGSYGSLVLDLLFRAPSPSPSSSSDAPTWADKLEAWATLGGAIVALAAAIATIWLLIHQMGEARRARADAIAARAETLATQNEAAVAQARSVLISDVEVDQRMTRDGVVLERIRGTITNFSSGPLRDVSVEVIVDSVYGSPTGEILKKAGVLGPGEMLRVDVQLDVLARTYSDAEREARSATAHADAVLAAQKETAVFFTDSAGVRWRRSIGKEPERVISPK